MYLLTFAAELDGGQLSAIVRRDDLRDHGPFGIGTEETIPDVSTLGAELSARKLLKERADGQPSGHSLWAMVVFRKCG
jgi:hypothetical protein